MNDTALVLLGHCYPLHQIEGGTRTALLEAHKPRSCRRGQTLLKRLDQQPPFLTFLVSGSAELRRSFFDRTPLEAGDDNTRQPLEALLPDDGGQIVALDECIILQLPRDAVDRALAAGATADEGGGNYSVAALRDADLTDEFLISDGSVEVDWMSRFLQSPLANHLPARAIQQLLACFTSRDVAKGEVLVKRGEYGDALFVLTRGMALVRTDPGSTFGGREFSLIPGDYFGEESLVADTVRNATVVMEVEGSVARLDRSAFDELIRPHLIPVADPGMAALPAELVDVRFPVEYRRDAPPQSRNIPISLLRASLNELEIDRRYLITRHGGRRSELAVFLLRQAGFDAYLLG